MSVHLIRLEANKSDVQHPLAEDEVYYVLSGSRTLVINVDGADKLHVDLSVGDLVYVPSGADHQFCGDSEITLLVFFAPNFSGPR